MYIYTYPRWWEFRKRGDVLGGHVTGQLEPIPADLLYADLLSLSYVKCGLHTGAGHHWCSWSGRNAFRRAPPDISGAAVAVSADVTAAAAVAAAAAESWKPTFFFQDIVAPSIKPNYGLLPGRRAAGAWVAGDYF